MLDLGLCECSAHDPSLQTGVQTHKRGTRESRGCPKEKQCCSHAVQPLRVRRTPPQPKEHDSGSICEPPSAAPVGALRAARGLWSGSARLLLALRLCVQQLGAFWNAFSGGKLFINRLLNLLFPKAYGMFLVIEKLLFCLLVIQPYGDSSLLVLLKSFSSRMIASIS